MWQEYRGTMLTLQLWPRTDAQQDLSARSRNLPEPF
jgi:hypothetical protein